MSTSSTLECETGKKTIKREYIHTGEERAIQSPAAVSNTILPEVDKSIKNEAIDNIQ